GDRPSPVLVLAAEDALERQLRLDVNPDAHLEHCLVRVPRLGRHRVLNDLRLPLADHFLVAELEVRDAEEVVRALERLSLRLSLRLAGALRDGEVPPAC